MITFFSLSFIYSLFEEVVSGSKRMAIIKPSMNIWVNNAFKILQKSHINIENGGYISHFFIPVLVDYFINSEVVLKHCFNIEKFKICFTDMVRVYIIYRVIFMKNKYKYKFCIFASKKNNLGNQWHI